MTRRERFMPERARKWARISSRALAAAWRSIPVSEVNSVVITAITAIAESTATRAIPRCLFSLVRIGLDQLLHVDPHLGGEGDLLLELVLDHDRDPHAVGGPGQAAVGILGRPLVLPGLVGEV